MICKRNDSRAAAARPRTGNAGVGLGPPAAGVGFALEEEDGFGLQSQQTHAGEISLEHLYNFLIL
jgi:hypothetical protein